METKTTISGKPMDQSRVDRPELRAEMRPARGLLVGIALSTILWLTLLVVWLAI